ncbi:hypothetical protein H483_0110045 [Dietzia sp. UCD-THP]|uniref:DUF2599 domain-containing protein n=1 Tax=Dietzia sp. UCD-THP TaxID=1292020 RepID=UPI000437952E|nr:DUF2599 domain-containing protein [Dietzia sp. UCD-THP]EYT62768.1 hypothetical protein H483_0110045 [Dietzia sp. UCD-THP]
MPSRPARPLVAAAAPLVIAAVTGCSGTGPGQRESPSVEEITSSSQPAPPSAEQRPSAPPTAASPEPGAQPAAAPLIASARWADSDFGVTLKVAPTPAGRQAWGPLDADAAWQEVVTIAPDGDTPGMREQFDCHWTWARILEPDKPTWNLEPWRPVVAAEQMLAEGCNPGGPEV